MTEPLCPYFGRCGGCSSQHIDYPVQLENKKKLLASALDKLIHSAEINAFSGSEYNYRNRMDFIFHQRGIGFRKKGDWRQIVDIERCEISNNLLNDLAKEVRDFFRSPDSFNQKKHSGTFRYAVIRAPENDSSISFVLNSDSARLKDVVEEIRKFSKSTTAVNVVVTYVSSKTDVSVSNDYFVVKGKDMLEEKYLGRTFLYSVQRFFQNNHAMAEKMIEYTRRILQSYSTKKAHLLDLYGGVGSFGITNSDLFQGVTVVENDKNCVDAAMKNISRNKIANAKAILADAKQLEKLEFPSPLFVITDPPRTGMHQKTIKRLRQLEPEVIIYVSCNAAQLSKEIRAFTGYTVKSAALFDLFPQTPHIEAVVEIVRKKQNAQSL